MALHSKHLSRAEIRRLLTAFAELGIRKVRLTGGEPTLRPDLLDVVRDISEIEGIEKVVLTTNGYRLEHIALDLKRAGVMSLNVSVDSLKPRRFFEITGQDRLRQVLGGISTARQARFSPIKINVVVMKGLNEDETGDFLDWSEREPIDVRFIELMATKDSVEFFRDHHLPLSFLERTLCERDWSLVNRDPDGGPAKMWAHPKAQGRVGFIRPHSRNFCDSCNRLRVTSEGALQLCLFGNGNVSLRPWLQDDGKKETLKNNVLLALGRKKLSHNLHEGDYGSTRNLAAMGG